MRNLQTPDFFKITRIARKLEVNIKKVVAGFDQKKSSLEGLTLTDDKKWKIFDRDLTNEELEILKSESTYNFSNIVDAVYNEVIIKMDYAEKEIKELMADLMGVKVVEVEKLELDQFLLNLKTIVSDKSFMSFFQQLKS